ncbi:hypothetical protein Tco_0895123 [Tanacetum coccineum]|uniref:Uncharacterized protein n=1 Tax=Tanacetum coccineum TaxID=301880 RepID=A0ABQ5CH51_9ASTR
MELKYQNQALKDGQHGQILNETSNKAKINKEIEVLEMINIELERSVAKLLIENEKLHMENEHLKQTYKDLYDSIKKTRVQTKDHNDSLIAQINSKTVENADLKAQIQEKVFANVALKNEIRKLKGNIVDTKFAKPSILGKSVLQPPRNQSVVRQPNAFKSERPNFSKQQFASQVDVNNVLSKIVTPHYLPKVRESVFVKPHHVIASGSSRNSSKESYGSNDMAHNYYLEEAKKKTQDKNMNLKPSVMHTTSLQNTTNGSKPKPRSNNQTSRSFPVSKSSCGMSNGVPLVDHSRNSSSFSDSKHFVGSTWIIFKCTQMIKRTAMASANNTLSPAPQRKERCTLQCALSSKEEKSSSFRPFSSTMISDSPVSTSIDQDAPSTSIPSTQEQEHSLIISQGFEESHEMPHFHDDPLHESLHEDSTSQGSSSNVGDERWGSVMDLKYFIGLRFSEDSDTYVFTMKMEILLVSTSNSTAVGYELTVDEFLKCLKVLMCRKITLASDTSIDFPSIFYLNHEERNFQFTHIVLSALRRSRIEND